MKNWLSIGQFAKRTGLSPRALRLYEKLGLIGASVRGANGYRYYRDDLIAGARKIREWKELGFTLEQIRTLQQAQACAVEGELERRLEAIAAEQDALAAQRRRVGGLLSSFHRDRRRQKMKTFEKTKILLTGVDDLAGTAAALKAKLPQAQVIDWDGGTALPTLQQQTIIILPSARLEGAAVGELRPDVILICNFGRYSKENAERYLRLYGAVSDATTTILNADDRASVEFAAEQDVRKGRIYYFSKNSGLREQIRKIGGVVSDGEEVEIFGMDGSSSLKIASVLAFHEEVSLIASLAVVMDLGLAV